MKYLVLLCDGMADYPVEELGGNTPLQYARTPNMDFLASYGETGLVSTIPDTLPPGSDVANLSVMGYDPEKYYTGRSPLEAVSMGIEFDSCDLVFRCNLVTLSDEPEYASKTMVDYSSDEINSEEAAILINHMNSRLSSPSIRFYTGKSYRHIMIWKNIEDTFELTPPHDILEKNIAGYLPKGSGSEILLGMMEESSRFLPANPINIERMERGLRPANSIWLWGQGRKPSLPSFYDMYGLKGSVISATDLVKGIGICAGMNIVNVKGATGNIRTNFTGKAEAAIKEFENGQDFVYLHIEAPDECSHRHEIANKVKAIELIDEKVLGPLMNRLKFFSEFNIMVLPDHNTPLSLRTHTRDPVPFLIYRSTGKRNPSDKNQYNEFAAKQTGLFYKTGWELMKCFLMK